ncbi:MAG: hypothetical protein KKD31_11950 [Bacteroidetes bacterium]|nr:hypothetical protein [Bacteroidota bacterium]
MKKILTFIIIAFIAITAARAQTISAADLDKIIKNPNVVVVCRKSAEYLKTHVSGAINIDVDGLNNSTPVEGTLKSTADLSSIFGQRGLSTSKEIIVYCKTGVNAGRMYWVLKYLGCSNVKMLDGQMDGWFAARKAITKNPTTLAATTFTASVNSKLKVDKAYVKSKLTDSKVVLVDTRKKVDYDIGHIGNAVNIPHENLLSGTKIKTVAALTAIFNGAGATNDKEIILYCKTSTTAGLAYFILSSLLNYTNVKVYDGAYLEWSK